MNPFIVVQTLGVLLLLFSTVLVAPLAVSLGTGDGHAWVFAVTTAMAVCAGLAMWLPLRHGPQTLLNRHGFLVVALLWAAVSLFGSIPFMLGSDLDFAQALFESASAFTTTGATVVADLDRLSPSLLFYRQELQWFGGIGVIVSAVALLPMLRIGGMQLYKAETPGPIKDEKLSPRIAQTARTLLTLYAGLSAACALLYWLAGMSAFDAVTHSFATLATGGFSTHDASFAWFDDPTIELIAIVFMILGGINFGLHFRCWRLLDPRVYLANDEVRWFVLVLGVVSAFAAAVLLAHDPSLDWQTAARHAVFTATSVMTTTGFGVDDFSAWPLALPVLVLLLSFLGGCAGSTSGGIKLVRIVVLTRQAGVQLTRLAHPSLVRPVKIDGRAVPDPIIEAVWGFFGVYVLSFAALMLALMMLGLDQVTAFGAVAACLNNLGPGLGAVASNFTGQPDAVLHLMTFAMLLGRLEIFTFLVLLTPGFWRA